MRAPSRNGRTPAPRVDSLSLQASASAAKINQGAANIPPPPPPPLGLNIICRLALKLTLRAARLLLCLHPALATKGVGDLPCLPVRIRSQLVVVGWGGGGKGQGVELRV